MKKYTLTLALAAILPLASAGAYEYVNNNTESYSTVRPVRATAHKTTTTTRKTGGYKNTITNNFYYAQPAQESSYTVEPRRGIKRPSGYVVYEDNYENDYYAAPAKRQVAKKQTRESYSYTERKYFLAHPFFQPLKGRFGSVTDIAYAKNSFKFDMLDASVLDIDPASATYSQVVAAGPLNLNGKQETTQFLVKEDFSYGITDTLALILMAQYDKTKISFKDWSSGDPADSLSDSGLNIFGIGIQNRFVDTDEWIAMVDASFLHQKNTANIFEGGVKAGYKIDNTTIYGLARIRYIDITDGDSYGAFVKDDTGDYIMLSYRNDTKDVFEGELGLGAFAVLGHDFTLNGELVYGVYDWHNQLSARGAFGWQPGDSFALNLYAMTSLYDSADGKTKKYMNYDVNPDVSGTNLVYTTGSYKIKDYNEWRIGLQAILYF